jgi:AraC-like DNA-binding protein
MPILSNVMSKSFAKKVVIMLILLAGYNVHSLNQKHARKENQTDTINKQIELQLELEKAKSEKDWEKVIATYRKIMFDSPKKDWIPYADSILTIAKRTKNDNTIGEAYLTKGIIYYNQKQNQKALDNYILADEYIVKTKNKYNSHKIKYAIAQTKYYLGFYDEAIALFKDGLDFFEEENELAYLSTLHALGLCYNKIKKYELCAYYNNLGFQASREFNNNEMLVYFEHSEGINNFFLQKHQLASQQLEKVIPILQSKKDYANETVAYFYLGKIQLNTKQDEKAITYFKKVEQAFTKYNYIRPDLREAFEILMTTAKKQKDIQLQNHYINQLFKVDSLLNTNYKYLSKKIHKEYDTKKLVEEREALNQNLKNNKVHNWIAIMALSCTVLGLIGIHFYNKRKNLKKFEAIMNKTTIKNKHSEKDINFDTEINPEIVKSILSNLEKLEIANKFLEKDLTLHKLATMLKTNTKYAAKVILKYRGKGTIEYITELKTNYIINLLKSENKYRNYTNKALAEEAGFGSTQNFTKAFKNTTGKSPTSFIQEISKQQTNH